MILQAYILKQVIIYNTINQDIYIFIVVQSGLQSCSYLGEVY
jgi:hypothetical protein